MAKSFPRIKVLSLSVLFLSCSLFSLSSPDFSPVEFADENVKSVCFEKEGWKLAYPFLQPGSGDEMTLSFDLLGGSAGTLWYNITHCDRNWNKSDLFTSDYLEGYDENQVTDFLPSFNTRVNYTHYRLTLPNNDVRFLTHQQAEITLTTGSLPVTDPYRQVTLTIMQNGRADRMHADLTPDFVGNGRLVYNTLSDKTLFPGGNEFRYFDIKTVRQTRQNVRAIDFVNGLYNAFLIPSDNREFKPYFFNEDFNGKSVVAIEESSDPDREADYLWVWFTLPAYQELQGGSLYVMGDFCSWQYTADNRMFWNAAKGCYEASLLLKQGWYNYEFAFLPDGASVSEGFHFEGSHWETENDYLVFTYFRDPTTRYDRLTGITLANTRSRQAVNRQ